MADKIQRAERWWTFICTRFLPQFWDDIKAGLVANMLGAMLAILIVFAQIHYGVIKSGDLRPQLLSIAWPYGLLILAFVVYHSARAPWLISNDHLDSIKLIEQAKEAADHELADREETIRRLTEKPPRTAAEQHAHEAVERALKVVGEKGITALRLLRTHGLIAFDFNSPSIPLPPGLTVAEALRVYRHCLSEGVVTSKTNIGQSEQIFTIPAMMEKALDHLLF
jgi:hypothetical protein